VRTAGPIAISRRREESVVAAGRGAWMVVAPARGLIIIVTLAHVALLALIPMIALIVPMVALVVPVVTLLVRPVLGVQHARADGAESERCQGESQRF
jgi:hypothetical protein